MASRHSLSVIARMSLRARRAKQPRRGRSNPPAGPSLRAKRSNPQVSERLLRALCTLAMTPNLSLRAVEGGEAISGHLGRLLRALCTLAMTPNPSLRAAEGGEAISGHLGGLLRRLPPPRNDTQPVIASRRRRRSNLRALGRLLRALCTLAMTPNLSLRAAEGGEAISGHLGGLLRRLPPPRNDTQLVIASRRRRRSNLRALGRLLRALCALAMTSNR